MRKLYFSFAALLLLFASCKEDIDTSARYVFSDHTIASYLESQSVYSEYVQLMKLVPMSNKENSSSVYQLMTARGNYTCFAITNDAIHQYLKELVEQGLISEPSWSAFTDSAKIDSIRKVIVRNSIIDGGDLETQRYSLATFPTEQNAEFPLYNINDHKLTYSWLPTSPDSMYINGNCPLDPVNCDIPLINGYIHQLHKVIAPQDQTCARFLQNVLDNQEEGLLMIAKAIQACDLMDTLSVERDEVYEEKYLRDEIPDMKDYVKQAGGDKSANSDPDAHAPEHRKIGFTIFAESDEYWRSQGVEPTSADALEQLVQWIQNNNMNLTDEQCLTDNQYDNKKHILYRWLTYHILPMRIPANKLVYHCNEVGFNIGQPLNYSIPVYEYYPVFGGDRLLKLFESKESGGVYLNRFPILDRRITGNGHEVGCDPDKVGSLVMTKDPLTVVNNITNACIYPIDAPLGYTNSVQNLLSRERIRFDLFSLFPEAITNGIRRADSAEGKYQHVYIPQDGVYKYFKNMSILNNNTHFIHYNGYKINWANYCQDEDKAFGRFDIMFTLPPVPKRGTYELRYKVLATSARGTVQVYFGSDPNNLPVAGIPVDMTKGLVDSFGEGASWGDLQDQGRDEDGIIDIDHKLRNHGLMKSGRHEVNEGSTALTARDDQRCCRHIMVRQTLDPKQTYYLRFKSVLDSEKKELYLDYFEWCPKEVYDNPSSPEDVW